MDLLSTGNAIDVVSEYLRTIQTPYAGAQFRLAFFNDGSAKRFVTGHVIFRESHVPSRPPARYKQKDHREFIFVEHWCREQWEAVKLLSKLLSGEAEIEGHKLELTFNKSEFDHRTYPFGRDLWTGRELRSRRDRDATWKELYIPQGPLTGRGLQPYLGPDHAINDWVFNLESWNPVGADVPSKDTIISFFPDLRARLLSADWRRDDNRLHIEVELKVDPEHVELQIVHPDCKDQSQSVPLTSGKIEVPIPANARSFSIFLLDDSGEFISHIELNEHQRTFGKADPHRGRSVYGRTLLNETELAFVSHAGIDLKTEGSLGLRPATNDRHFMEIAVAEARKSTAEDDRSHPKVGAVVVKNGQILATAHRGEIPGCHAEYIALEKKLADVPVSGATVYTTLEPCTTRNHPKLPCALRLIERRVARVVIGTLDPNPDITGKGQRSLTKAKIAVSLFDSDLVDQIEELNREFTRYHETRDVAAKQASSSPQSPMDITIVAATFSLSDTGAPEPQVNLRFRLDMAYRGPKSTLSVHEIEMPEMPLKDKELYSFFTGERDKHGPRIPLEPGYSGVIKCSITGKVLKSAQDIPSRVSGYIAFKDTYSPRAATLPFTAEREP
jgi:pyrimidine deaminase RibD-like protein